MHDYDMLADNDRVLVAVSGGVDSLVLTWLLDFWRQKAPIHYEITAIHLDMGFDSSTAHEVEKELHKLRVPYVIEKTNFGKEALALEDGANGCYHCSRQRRNKLFETARRKGYTKVAFGHHQEDIIETFFLNMLYSGNISTMVPRQDLFDGKLSIIRPLAYLEKEHITLLAESLHIKPVPNPCPMAKDSQREKIRETLRSLYKNDKRIKPNVFSALANIKTDYLLKPHAKRK